MNVLRKNRTISYGAIHAINSTSPLYLQPFGVVQLTVSAAGADTDIRLDAVPGTLRWSRSGAVKHLVKHCVEHLVKQSISSALTHPRNRNPHLSNLQAKADAGLRYNNCFGGTRQLRNVRI